MSRERRLTEELGWLKVLFAAFVAVIGSLVSWFKDVTSLAIGGLIVVFVLAALIGAMVVVRILYKRLDELEDL